MMIKFYHRLRSNFLEELSKVLIAKHNASMLRLKNELQKIAVKCDAYYLWKIIENEDKRIESLNQCASKLQDKLKVIKNKHANEKEEMHNQKKQLV